MQTKQNRTNRPAAHSHSYSVILLVQGQPHLTLHELVMIIRRHVLPSVSPPRLGTAGVLLHYLFLLFTLYQVNQKLD